MSEEPAEARRARGQALVDLTREDLELFGADELQDRILMLEAEIARGARNLLIFGGTPHAMRHAFEEESVADLIVQRKGLRAGLACRAARWFSQHGSRLGKTNFLAEVLSNSGLRWAESPALARQQHASVPAVVAGSQRAA